MKLFLNKSVFGFAVAAIVTMLAVASAAIAADNAATGNISGNTTALTDSPTITLNSTTHQLKLVKRAFLNDGTWLNNPTLPQGTTIKFVIYIESDASVTVTDVNIVDALAGFTYVAGSIKVNNTAALCAVYGSCTQAEEEAIYAAVNGEASFLDDGLNATDVAGYNGSDTISAGSSTSNLQLDIASGVVWSIMFSVTLD